MKVNLEELKQSCKKSRDEAIAMVDERNDDYDVLMVHKSKEVLKIHSFESINLSPRQI